MRDEFAKVLEGAAAEFEGLHVLRPDIRLLMPHNRVNYLKAGKLLYIDDNHLSDEGAELFRPLFRKALNEAIRRSEACKTGPNWSAPAQTPTPACQPHSSHERL